MFTSRMIAVPLSLRSIEPHRHVPEIQAAGAYQRAHRHYNIGGRNALGRNRPHAGIFGIGLGRVKPHRRCHDPLKLGIGNLFGPARRYGALGGFDKICAGNVSDKNRGGNRGLEVIPTKSILSRLFKWLAVHRA